MANSFHQAAITTQTIMSSFRQWLASQMELSLMRAEARQIRRYFMENIFLLGIEIGLGRRLSGSERFLFQKSFSTAEALIAIGKYTGSAKFDREFRQNVDRIVADWLHGEPVLKANLEWLLRMPLEEFNQPGAIPLDLRMTLKKEMKELAESCGESLTNEEIETILQKLEKPLDRA